MFGDDLVDPSPSTKEGQELVELERPWEHPDFWSYLHRSILRARLGAPISFISHLVLHSSPIISSLATLAVQILESFPRSTGFRDERAFLSALREWKSKAHRAGQRAEELYPDIESDEDWEDGFRGIFELCAGKEGRILEVSEDWKEALAAWGIWVNPTGKREDLPSVFCHSTYRPRS